MRIILETDSKAKRSAQRGYSGVMGLSMTRGKYSDAVLLGIFKKIFKRLNMIDFTVVSDNAVTIGTAKYFLNNEINQAFAELFNNGFILFQKTENGKVKYIRKIDAVQTPNGWIYDGKPLHQFYSDTFDVFGKSDAMVLKDVLKGIDNSLNAAQTVIKRLGVVIVGTPEQPSQNPQLVSISADDKTELEENIAKDYGMIDEQKQFMLLRKPLKLTRIALGGKDLLITDTVDMFVKLLCDATNIPYDVMALSGQSTFANMEQAEKSMQDTAEEYVSKIWTFFKTMGVEFNWTINNSKYGKQTTTI